MLVKQNRKFLLSLAIMLFIIGAFGLAFFCFTPISQAAVDDYEQGVKDLVLPGIGVEVSLVQTVVNIINIFLGVLGLIAVILIMYGGFVWMTARGSAEQVEKAKKIISRTLIGLAVILLSYVIVYMVMKFVTDWAQGQSNPEQEEHEYTPLVDIDDMHNFKALEVSASHIGNNPAKNVRLCSNIQTRFNNSVKSLSENLKIAKINNNTEEIISKQDNWDLSGNFISYINADLYEKNTEYKLYLPNSLEDSQGNYLLECLASPSCVVSGANFVWNFVTGEEVDKQAPNITSTTPENNSININLSPYIQIDFDEEIDALSVTADSIKVFDSKNILVDSITEFDISSSRISFSFNSDLKEFETYKIVVSGIEDLCNNPMSANYEFSFTTGNQHSAVSGYYPTSQNVCPDQIILFDFSVSMQGNIVTFGLVKGTDTKYISLGKAEITKTVNDFGTLKMVNSNFTAYEFEPENFLNVNTSYHAYVDTDKQINEQGEKLKADWTFKTSTQEDCSCEPYISQISPYQGGPGECLTAQGTCFLGKDDYTLQPVSINFDNQQVPVASGSYTDRGITTIAPTSLTMDGDKIREVKVKYIGKQDLSNNQIASNERSFYIITNQESQGPCLYGLSPSSGKAGDSVKAYGERFGVSKGKLTFQLNQESVIKNWNITEIESLVPDLAQTGDVFVENIAGKKSNPVYFEIRSDTPQDLYLMVMNDSRCEMVESAIDVFPSPNPRNGSVGMCRNIVISARFNKLINDSTVNSNNIKVYECADTEKTPDEGGCDVSNLVQGDLLVFIYQYSQEGFKFVPSNILKPNHYYKITLSKQGLVAEDLTKLRDDYIWYFKVQNSENNCDAKYIDVNPFEYFTRINGKEIKYQSSAFADNCIEIPANNLTWTWRSSEPSIAVISVFKSNVATTTIVGGTNAGETDIVASTLGKEDKGKLTYDPDKCSSNLDCVDYYGNGSYMCNGSVCDVDTKQCAPVINSLNPDKGPIGRFVTVQGCHFGNSKGLGKVKFGDEQAGYPCNVNWSDTQIIVKVPNNAGSMVQVIANNNLLSNKVSFSIEDYCGSLDLEKNEIPPGLCGINPAQQRIGATVNISGENLLLPDEPKRNLFFNEIPVLNFDSWDNQSIRTKVPEGANSGEVWVEILNCPSNSLNFTLIGKSCDINTNTPICEANQSVCSSGLVCQESTCACELPGEPDPLTILNKYPTGNNVMCVNLVADVLFNTLVSSASLSGNIKMWEQIATTTEHIDSNCKLVAFQQKNNKNIKSNNFWQKIITKILDFIKTAFAATGDPAENYWCPFNISLKTELVKEYKEESKNNNKNICANGCARIKILPTKAFSKTTKYKIEIIGRANGVKSQQGGKLKNDATWEFSTTDNAQICKLTDVKIVPENYIFTKDKEQFTFIAKAMSNNKEIFTSALYPFVWSWSKKEKDDNKQIIAISNSNTNENIVTANNQNGQATLYATASTTDVGFYDKKTGSSAITNFLCENPVSIKDDRGASNYTTMYCRDNSPDLLPNATQQNIDYTSQDILTEKFVLIEDSSDAIGIRVYKNTDKLSSEQWYKSKAPNQSGSVSHIDIDGYDGAQDGRSIYVTAVNHKAGLYYNMYIMSYNDGALADSINIFNQLVENWQFNDNITDLEKRDALHRDVRRIYDLADMKQYLTDYYTKNATYPKLSAGSYVQQEATSLWPSWQQTLGADLGKSLPIDPINKFARQCSNNTNKNCWENSDCKDNGLCVDSCPAGYDVVSCWNSATHNFICPDGSHIYWYISKDNGTSFNIYANMEYEAWSKDDTCKDYFISNN